MAERPAERRTERFRPGYSGGKTRHGPARAQVAAVTVYDTVTVLLGERGWSRGRPRGVGGRLDLGTAVDVVAGVHGGVDGPSGEELARASRIRLHLAELAGTTSLPAWNDAQEWPAVARLLRAAAALFPDD